MLRRSEGVRLTMKWFNRTEGLQGHLEGFSIDAFPFCQGSRAKIWRRKAPASCRKR
jgi:hypothetical protein